MKKEQSLAWGKVTFFLGALLLSQAFLSSAFARSNGSITSEDACSDCHSGLGATTVMILGPDTVAHDSTSEYTFQISQVATTIQGGLDVAAGIWSFGPHQRGNRGYPAYD